MGDRRQALLVGLLVLQREGHRLAAPPEAVPFLGEGEFLGWAGPLVPRPRLLPRALPAAERQKLVLSSSVHPS